MSTLNHNNSAFVTNPVWLCLLVLLISGASLNNTFAQGQTNTTQQKCATMVNPEEVTPTQAAPAQIAPVQVDPTAADQHSGTELPYANYKGITDLGMAKEAWVKDHPELYTNQQNAALPETHFLSMDETNMKENLKQAQTAEIKSFIKEVLAAPLPEDYQLPESVRTASSGEIASGIISSRYPEFFGLQGPEFLQSISGNPVRYMEMIREYKAVRALFTDQSTNKNQ